MTDESKEILKAIADLKQDVKSVQLTLENVTNKNIQIIAEGHYKPQIMPAAYFYILSNQNVFCRDGRILIPVA